METTTSFAPLAKRLAAKVAEIRPAAGAEISWANFMALFWCAIFEMLILLCEALDARAAADARFMASPAKRQDASRPVFAVRPVAERAPRLALVPDVQAIFPTRDAALFGTVGRTPVRPWLAWSRDAGPIWAGTGPPSRLRRETRLCALRPSTPILLRLSNK